MGQRRKADGRAQERWNPLAVRIDELELRIRMLEAKLRETTAQLEAAAPRSRRAKPTARSVRAQPRCPGCMLELPKGRRDEHCVWCGFYLPALKERAQR